MLVSGSQEQLAKLACVIDAGMKSKTVKGSVVDVLIAIANPPP